jgi:chloramphenicol O-acetyltransferase type A
MTPTRNAGSYIDLTSWKRREHFLLFRDAVQPFFAMTVEIDVTALRSRCDSDDGPPFSIAAFYAVLRAANDTEAFRLRLRGDRAWLHDTVGLTTTVLRDDTTFGFARFESADTLEEFILSAREELSRVKHLAPLEIPEPGDDALIYHSTIPWLRFTSFTNAIGKHDDSVPRVVFGRCTREGLSVAMPVSVEVHHALVDGIDVARFVERLQQRLNE